MKELSQLKNLAVDVYIKKIEDCKIRQPKGLAVDSNGTVYVSEENRDCVSVFTSKGQFVKSFGSHGTNPGQFDRICGLAVDISGVVYVCDNNRIQMF